MEEKVKLIQEKYYHAKRHFDPYTNTKHKLAQLVLEEKFPTPYEWNQLAEKEGYFSSVSIKYIEQCDWRELEIKIRQELKELLK